MRAVTKLIGLQQLFDRNMAGQIDLSIL